MSGSSNGCAAKIHYMFVKNEFSMREQPQVRQQSQERPQPTLMLTSRYNRNFARSISILKRGHITVSEGFLGAA
jgi:hypothetical protein